MKSNWLLAQKYDDGFGQDWGYSDIVLQLLWNRGTRNKKAAEEFFHPDYGKLHNPYLFSQMERAIERILLAKEKNEGIFIFADYDADGVPGAAILDTVLRAYGIEPKIYIPHREREGYGLNTGAIDYMKEEGAKVIITCDCGVSNNQEIAYAKERQMDIIVTDHHTLPSELPDAYAIVHPEVGSYPFKFLSGGGVAYKLAQGILKSRYEPAGGIAKEALEKWLLDLVAISTVADVMPLCGENRILVSYGLKVLNKTRRPGLRKLIEAAGLTLGKITTDNIGFQIAPRINAAGRMDHANTALQLLISQDEKEVEGLAGSLNENNRERQKQTDIIINEAKYQIIKEGKEKDYCLFAFNPRWPLGVLGLAAGKISDEFFRPVILLTEAGGKIKGSARGVEGWNIIEALRRVGDLFSACGGHPTAAGMTLKNQDDLEIFEKRMLEWAGIALQDKEFLQSLKIDMEIKIDEANLELCGIIKKFEPFGEANPAPRFLSYNLEIRGLSAIGNGEKHLRLLVAGKGGRQYKMIGFCQAHWCQVLKIGDRVDAVYELSVNEWNGKTETQMKIVDIEKINPN